MSAAFKQSGTAVGVECWRVEQLQPVPATANGQLYSGVFAMLALNTDAEAFAKLLWSSFCSRQVPQRTQASSGLSRGDCHTGDAYVLLSTSKRGASPALLHAIHFWLGMECSQDEGAGAAMLAVQLDNALSARGSDAAISRYIAPSSYVKSSCEQQYLSLIHISEPTRLRRISYAVFCLKKKKKNI